MSVSNKKSIDMTSGALWNKILLFALPLAASSILQQLFNSVDTAEDLQAVRDWRLLEATVL